MISGLTNEEKTSIFFRPYPQRPPLHQNASISPCIKFSVLMRLPLKNDFRFCVECFYKTLLCFKSNQPSSPVPLGPCQKAIYTSSKSQPRFLAAINPQFGRYLLWHTNLCWNHQLFQQVKQFSSCWNSSFPFTALVYSLLLTWKLQTPAICTMRWWKLKKYLSGTTAF